LEYATKRAREAEVELARLQADVARIRGENQNLHYAMLVVRDLVGLQTRDAYLDPAFGQMVKLPADWRKWTTEQYQEWIDGQQPELRRAVEFLDKMEGVVGVVPAI